ncbi:MAG: hypothetical protein ACXV5J_14650 [Candidatus Angelobacter sp.]
MQGLSNLIAIENFDTRDFRTNHIKDEHSFAGAEFYIAVVGTVGALRAGFSVKRRTKVIPTTTAVNDGERMYLC